MAGDEPFCRTSEGRAARRRVLNGIFWVRRLGAPWRDLPERYGPRTTCYNRFVRWLGGVAAGVVGDDHRRVTSKRYAQTAALRVAGRVARQRHGQAIYHQHPQI